MLSDRTRTARVRCLLERGRAWNDSGRATEAIAAFSQAFALASAAKLDALAVDAVHMLGVMPPDDIPIVWNHRGIEIAERSADPQVRRWIGTLYMNLGVTYQQLTQYSDAERAFTSAVLASEQTANIARVRLAKLCLLKNMRLRGDAGNALRLDRQLLEEIQAAHEPEGYALEEIAECLLALRRDDEAKPIFARAFAALSAYPWFPPTEGERLQRLKVLGGV
jgi:tetratricopeptide (TPR) repeat protein